MTHMGKYLYCIIRCPEERTFEHVAPIGDSESQINTIVYEELAVVVSDIPVQEYDSTRTNLLAHQRVQEHVMQDFTLLPVRFGTVAASEQPDVEVRKLLKRRYQEFDELLASMEDKVELGLKVLWRDEGAVFAELLSENSGISRLRKSIEGRPPNLTHFERIKLGEMVKEALDGKRSSEALRVLDPCEKIAIETVENEIIMDRMVVNAAFLVGKGHEQQFDQVVDKLDEELGNRMSFKYIGPVPPYNFVNIVVNWEDL